MVFLMNCQFNFDFSVKKSIPEPIIIKVSPLIDLMIVGSRNGAVTFLDMQG
jgi:hypothetical protein